MAGAYWGENLPAEAGAGLLWVLLGCYAVGAVVATTSAIIYLVRGKPLSWKQYGQSLAISGLVYYGIVAVIFILASPFVLLWMAFR